MTRSEMTDTAILFFCHGARDPRWREPLDEVVAQFRREHPELRAELAFLELCEPRLPDLVASFVNDGYRSIRVVPLFLAPGGHTQRDLPALLDQARERWPLVRFTQASTLTEAAPVRDAIVRWARQAVDI